MIISIGFRENQSTERLSNLLKATKLVSDEAGCHEPLPLLPSGRMTTLNAIYYPTLADFYNPPGASHIGRWLSLRLPFPPTRAAGVLASSLANHEGGNDEGGQAKWERQTVRFRGKEGPNVFFFLTTYTLQNQQTTEIRKWIFLFNSQIMLRFEGSGSDRTLSGADAAG